MSKSILSDVGDIIDGAFGLKRIDGQGIGKAPHFRHRESCRTVSNEPVPYFDGKANALIRKMYEKIESNLNADRSPSKKNWCLRKSYAKTGESKAKNRDKKIEVKLERKIVTIPDGWFNQVPTASGLVNKHSDKRGSIDLVHRCDGSSYEFIELKVRSDNPLFAAMEILQYGILYILARTNKQVKDVGEDKKLLKAKAIHLKVLAPTNYYKEFKLEWLESGINDGLKHFLVETNCGFLMDFEFEAFPSCFSLSPFPTVEVIRKALKARKPVYP